MAITYFTQASYDCCSLNSKRMADYAASVFSTPIPSKDCVLIKILSLSLFLLRASN